MICCPASVDERCKTAARKHWARHRSTRPSVLPSEQREPELL